MTPQDSHLPDFDPIALPYRYLEYLTLGPALQRCRTHFLPALQATHRALVLGDGDGRFLATLLASNPHLQAEAVDTSTAMLHLLRSRCHTAATRLTTHHTSALTFQPRQAYDLIAAHFVLDCLTQPELESLITHLAPHLTPKALWVISDFRIPPTGPMHLPARIFIRALYAAFRILTGLRTTHLPNHAKALTQSGFTCIAHHHSFLGLLTTELWQI